MQKVTNGKRKFPLLVQEGCLRQQFRPKDKSTGGDGVVTAKSLGLFSTTSPKSMGLRSYQDTRLVHMDLGTSRFSGRIFRFTKTNKLQESLNE